MTGQLRGFSLEGFAQGALSDCTITLHAGMGVGQLSVLYVGGDQPRNEPAAEDAAQPSILQGPHAALRRDGVAVMGAPITQLQKAEANTHYPTWYLVVPTMQVILVRLLFVLEGALSSI